MTGIRLADIDATALQQHVDALGQIGREDDLLFRPVYSPQWLQARDQLRAWMENARLETRVDAVGNLIGRLDGGTEPETVLTGSHIDTVRDAGRYDGALGVLGGIAAAEAIQRSGLRLRRPIEVVALCEEEGSRFAAAAYWGTRAILGEIAADEADRILDDAGVTIGAAMRGVGLDPEGIPAAVRNDIAAFIELHIEQGRVLENAGVDVGIVRAITGLKQLLATISGEADHAGTTPMGIRRDALAGAAEAFIDFERLAKEAGEDAVVTVGQLTLKPNASNVVPETVHFSIDIRVPDQRRLNSLTDAVCAALQQIAARRGLTCTVRTVESQAPAILDRHVQDVIGQAAATVGASSISIVSGAGHDSQAFARRVATGMIFTPSRRGLSHNPAEFTSPEQVVRAAGVLARTLAALASGDVITKATKEHV